MITLHRSLLVLLAAFLAAAYSTPSIAQEESQDDLRRLQKSATRATPIPRLPKRRTRKVSTPTMIRLTPMLSDATYQVVDFRTDMALFSAMVFVLLLIGLASTAWKPIMQGLEKRERGIADNIARAEKAAQDATSKVGRIRSQACGCGGRVAATCRRSSQRRRSGWTKVGGCGPGRSSSSTRPRGGRHRSRQAGGLDRIGRSIDRTRHVAGPAGRRSRGSCRGSPRTHTRHALETAQPELISSQLLRSPHVA